MEREVHLDLGDQLEPLASLALQGLGEKGDQVDLLDHQDYQDHLVLQGNRGLGVNQERGARRDCQAHLDLLDRVVSLEKEDLQVSLVRQGFLETGVTQDPPEEMEALAQEAHQGQLESEVDQVLQEQQDSLGHRDQEGQVVRPGSLDPKDQLDLQESQVPGEIGGNLAQLGSLVNPVHQDSLVQLGP